MNNIREYCAVLLFIARIKHKKDRAESHILAKATVRDEYSRRL